MNVVEEMSDHYNIVQWSSLSHMVLIRDLLHTVSSEKVQVCVCVHKHVHARVACRYSLTYHKCSICFLKHERVGWVDIEEGGN